MIFNAQIAFCTSVVARRFVDLSRRFAFPLVLSIVVSSLVDSSLVVFSIVVPLICLSTGSVDRRLVDSSSLVVTPIVVPSIACPLVPFDRRSVDYFSTSAFVRRSVVSSSFARAAR
jgi:hypothetical protein